MFDGTKLGEVSSRQDVSISRWTELSLFKTDSGQYILEKVGRSIVTHVSGCSEIRGRIPRFQEAHPGDDPDFGYHYHECVPVEYDFTQLLIEEDRYHTTVSPDPRQIVEALYRTKPNSRYLPRVSINLLISAEKHDSILADAWRIERI